MPAIVVIPAVFGLVVGGVKFLSDDVGDAIMVGAVVFAIAAALDR